MKGTIEITDEVCALLGKTREEISNMGLRELAYLAFDKGVRIHVPPMKPRTSPDGADLTMRVVHELQSETV